MPITMVVVIGNLPCSMLFVFINVAIVVVDVVGGDDGDQQHVIREVVCDINVVIAAVGVADGVGGEQQQVVQHVVVNVAVVVADVGGGDSADQQRVLQQHHKCTTKIFSPVTTSE